MKRSTRATAQRAARHKRGEAKRARRQARALAETPEQFVERQERLLRAAETGAKRLAAAIPEGPRSNRKRERLIPVPCTCSPPKDHGPHWTPERLVPDDVADAIRKAAA